MKVITALLMLALLTGCKFPESEQEKTARAERELLSGEYVYIDRTGVLHFEIGCFYISGTIQNGEYVQTESGVLRVLKENITDEMLSNCCHDCVTDARFKSLIRR